MFKQFLCILFLFPSLVLATECIEGKDYQLIANPEPLSANNKPQVMEFFSYGCPGCYKLEPKLGEWLAQLGSSINLSKVPVVFHAGWDLYAKAYYLGQVLAQSNTLNPILFKTIQEDKNSLNDKQAMIDFLAAQGLDKEIVRAAFEDSSTINNQIATGTALMARYQITTVPAFVVNNKYKTDMKMTGGAQHLFEVLDYLIRKS